jgi:elongation factor G
MGELHLEIAIRRASRALGIELKTGGAQIRERRQLSGAGSGEATVHHPTGRARVRVVVAVEPHPTFIVEVPPLERVEWRDAVTSGLEAAAGIEGQQQRQLLGGRLRAQVEVHGVDVVPIMFRDAAEWAALRSIDAAGAQIAEPWCALTVIAPDAAVGRVVGDIARRRGRVRRTETRGPMHELTVDAPLAELVGYASDLRSLTAGRGQFSIEPVGYRVLERHEPDA